MENFYCLASTGKKAVLAESAPAVVKRNIFICKKTAYAYKYTTFAQA